VAGVQLGLYPSPRHIVAHLSDTHLLADGALQYGAVDPEPGLVRALTRLADLADAPQAIVVTGDLTDLGEPAAYRRLRELVEPAATALGATVVWVMGNHDERAAYSAGLFGERSDRPQDRVYDLAGLRIIALDTSVPGYHHGEVSSDQLGWLAEELATPAEHGTVLAMHHPPIPLPLDPASQVIELDGQRELAAVLQGSDVRAILAGHMHYSSYSSFAGIPVSVAAATCYTVDLAARDRLYSAVDGHQAISLVHLYEPGAGGIAGAPVVHSTVPLASAPEIFGAPRSATADLAALSPTARRELLSRKPAPVVPD
jgi:3',5'-cyclic AMP phosphodiesterase CpdA